MQPDVSTVHVDMALTNVSIAYKNSGLVADMLFPMVPVNKQSNKYFVYSKDRFRVKEDARRPGAKANEIVWDLSTDQYYAEGHALAQAIPDELRSNADQAVDMDVDTTENLTDSIDLQREILAATKATNASVITQTSSGDAWDGAGTPVADVETAKATIRLATGVEPNTLLLSYPVFQKTRRNSEVLATIQYVQPTTVSSLTAQQLASVFGVDSVLVAGAIKNTADEGATDAMDWVWGKNALLFYRPPSMGLRTLSLGAEFRWLFGANTQGVLVKRYRDESRTADVVEVQRYHDLKIVAAPAAYLWTSVIT